jgi:hypothetical protein
MKEEPVQDSATPSHYAAYVAFDWADQKHDVRLLDAASRCQEYLQIEHSPEALTDFVNLLRKRFGPGRVALAVELKRGPLINFLCAYEFIDIYPVKTTTLSHYRKAFYPSGAKSDPLDCDLILEILLKHPNRLESPWKPDTPQTRMLAELTQARRGFVDQLTVLSQKLRACLKNYYPLAIDILGGNLDNRLACDLLLRWPTLEELQKARPSTLRHFFHQHNCRSEKRIAKALQLSREALPLTSDQAIIAGQRLRAITLLKQMRALLPSIGEYDARIAELFNAHPDAAIFKSLPGAGEVIAPRLLAALGTRRERFAHRDNLCQYNGCAPVTESSGKQKWVHWRWAAPVFVRQSFVELARWSIGHCGWARAYNELLRDKGDGFQTRLRKIGFKWSRIIYRCWKARSTYDEVRYLQRLKATGSPIWDKLQQLKTAVSTTP